MKKYESEFNTKLDPKLPFIIRLDGHTFSKWTKPFKKPWDERIWNCMLATTIDLVLEFNATTGFTCSDEITLLFPVFEPISEDDKKDEVPELIFSGKVQKLVSLTAGFASASFNRHMAKQHFNVETEQDLIAHIQNKNPYFDSRIFQVPGNHELLNNLLWRSRFDYRRNSISGLARAHFSTKEMHGLSSPQLLEKLADKGIHWDQMPNSYKYGDFVKREKYEMEAQTPKGEKVNVMRTRTVVKSFDLVGFSKENEDFLCCKYLS